MTPDVTVLTLPDAGPNRSITLVGEKLAMIGLVMRESSTAYGRIKAVFIMPVPDPESGDQPVAAKMAEFRLEMN